MPHSLPSFPQQPHPRAHYCSSLPLPLPCCRSRERVANLSRDEQTRAVTNCLSLLLPKVGEAVGVYEGEAGCGGRATRSLQPKAHCGACLTGCPAVARCSLHPRVCNSIPSSASSPARCPSAPNSSLGRRREEKGGGRDGTLATRLRVVQLVSLNNAISLTCLFSFPTLPP